MCNFSAVTASGRANTRCPPFGTPSSGPSQRRSLVLLTTEWSPYSPPLLPTRPTPAGSRGSPLRPGVWEDPWNILGVPGVGNQPGCERKMTNGIQVAISSPPTSTCEEVKQVTPVRFRFPCPSPLHRDSEPLAWGSRASIKVVSFVCRGGPAERRISFQLSPHLVQEVSIVSHIHQTVLPSPRLLPWLVPSGLCECPCLGYTTHPAQPEICGEEEKDWASTAPDPRMPPSPAECGE